MKQKKLCQQEMKFKVKLAEMCRAYLGIVQTQGKVAGEGEGLGDAPPVWDGVSLAQRRSSGQPK